MISKHSDIESLIGNAYRAKVAVAALALLVSGCAQSAPENRPNSVDSSRSEFSTLKPDMKHFLQTGSTAICAAGGARPCAILIREKPELNSRFVNADPTQQIVRWPLETYQGQGNDKVAIDCYVPDGQEITTLDNRSASSFWYRVLVAAKHIENTEIQNEITDNTSDLQQTSFDGQPAVFAWASVEWFGGPGPSVTIPQCEDQ